MDLKGDYDYYGDNCVKSCLRAISKTESGTEARVPQGLTEPEEVTTANILVTET